jgi:hypothetical protein
MVSSNTITVGNLSSFLLYAAYIGVSLGTFSNFYSELNKSVGAAARIWEIIDREPVIPMKGKTQERVQSSLTDFARRWSGTNRDSPRPHRIQGHPIQLPGPRRRPDLRKLPAGDLPRQDGGRGGAQRFRQKHSGGAAAAPVRPLQGPGLPRRARRKGARPQLAAQTHRYRQPGTRSDLACSLLTPLFRNPSCSRARSARTSSTAQTTPRK